MVEDNLAPPKYSKSYPGSFADAGHVYVHMRNGIIGEQVGGHGCEVMGDSLKLWKNYWWVLLDSTKKGVMRSGP